MADSEVSVRFTSKEEAQLWQSFVKLSSSFAKAKQGATDTAKATGDLDKSLKAFAEREIKLDTTPWQAMLTQVGKLDAALKAGMLTPEQHAAAHARAVAKMRDAYGQVKPVEMKPVTLAAAAGPSEELRKFAEQTRRINATPLERYQATMLKLGEATRAGVLSQEDFRRAAKAAQDDYQRELDASARKTRGLSDAAKDAGGGVSGAFGSMLSGVGVSVGSLMALTGKVFSGIRAEADKSAQDVMASYKALGKLGQIGGAKLTAERRQMADEYFASGAVPSRAEAAQTILELANTGALGDRRMFADLQKTGLVESPADIATMSQQLRQTLGEKEAGSFPLLLARAMAAAEPVNTTPDVLLRAAARSGQAAGTLGIKAPDLLAATTTMIQAKGAEEGGSRLASLLAKITTLEGVDGAGLFDRLQSIQAKGMTPAQLKKFFGDDTAVEAFGILSKSAGDTQQLSARVSAATPEILTRKVAEQMAVPEIAAGVQAAAAASAQQLKGRERGLRSLRADAAVAEGVENIRERGFPIGDRRVGFGVLAGETGKDIDASLASVGVRAARFLPGADQVLADASRGGTRRVTGRDLAAMTGPAGALLEVNLRFAELLGKMIVGQEATTKAAEKLDKAADRLGGGRAPASQRFDWSGAARRDQAAEAK